MIDPEAWELVPRRQPDNVPPWVPIALANSKVDDDRQNFAYAWAQRLLDQLGESGLSTAIIGAVGPDEDAARISDISAGFIPFAGFKTESAPGTREHTVNQFVRRSGLPYRVAKNRSYTFGVVVGLESELPSRALEFQSEFTQLVSLDGSFPVVCEHRRYRQDAPPNPVGNATSACYAKPRVGKRFYSGVQWNEGVLVARHVLTSIGTSPGTLVPLNGHPNATLADVDTATTIDAAILDIGPAAVPTASASLQLAQAVKNVRVDVRGRRTTFQADVLRIMDDSRYFGNLVAHRAFLDAHGVPGDSGALVKTSSYGDAVGLYIGATGAALPEGIVQLIRQVTEYFEIDVYD